MADDGGIHLGHICWGPCKQVKVLGQEMLELVLSGRKLHAYSENSLMVIGVLIEQLYLLRFGVGSL